MSSFPTIARGSVLSAPAAMAIRLGYQNSRMIVWVILCIGLTICIVNSSAASATTRHVILLFDERAELPGTAMLSAEFTRTLISNPADRIEIYREAMDLSRFNSDTYRELLRNFLRAKYAGKNIDAAVAI